jgi:hypothetical protein
MDKQLELEQLESWLSANFDDDVLMPCNGKLPTYAHSDNKWGWDEYVFEKERNPTTEVGVLLNRLCVVDVDDIKIANELESQFPILLNVPRESTLRGMHYYFLRSPLADAHGYYNGASQRIKGVDLKTICRTGTRSFLVVSPSKNKKWIVPPWARNLEPIPDDLLTTVGYPKHQKIDIDIFFNRDQDFVKIRANHYLSMFGYFKPFIEDFTVEGEIPQATIPDKFSKESFEALLDVFHRHEQNIPQSIHTFKNIELVKELADFLDVPPWLWKLISDEVPLNSWRVIQDLRDIDPVWASHSFPENNDIPLVSIENDIKYVPLRDLHDDRWLMHDVQHSTTILPGEIVVCASSLSTKVWKALPLEVQWILQHYPDNLIVAGGWTLGECVKGTPPGNDIDIFIVNTNSSTLANQIVSAYLSHSKDVLTSASCTGCAVTAVHYDYLVQFVLKLYETSQKVLADFDFDPCRIFLKWNSENEQPLVQCTESWIDAVSHRAFFLDPSRWNSATVSRTWKYYSKSFEVFLPGCVRSLFKDEHLRTAVFRRTKCNKPGIVNLFYVERCLYTINGRHPGAGQAPRPLPCTVKETVRTRVHWGYGTTSGYDQMLFLRSRFSFIIAIAQIARNAMQWVMGTAPTCSDKTTNLLNHLNDLNNHLFWKSNSAGPPMRRRFVQVGHLYKMNEYALSIKEGRLDKQEIRLRIERKEQIRLATEAARQRRLEAERLLSIFLAAQRLAKTVVPTQIRYGIRTSRVRVCPVCNTNISACDIRELEDHLQRQHADYLLRNSK